MDLLILQLMAIAGLLWLWAHRASAAPKPDAPSIDLRPPVRSPQPQSVATIHLVFVESDDQTLLLDCVLAETYGAVPAGQSFTMVVRLPAAIAVQLALLFERWSDKGCAVQLRVALDQHGPRARFRFGDAEARLEILASSPLRGVDGRS